ncbi:MULTISPECIES: cyclic pyranopterin monophosphate synthase MoaC [unclassified Fusibacter]|uniref:cyclic pyranopterin monophosphate synthase MoaC n=1 Tax=unclassified Fusibacter TaxID=2624464 RepID=UPI00101117FB|nr:MULTISPECIES: cyclic pyranopterin monophosphate synthase MoaC [unclassified Fusibacter]MCK8061412.1 cyclic pyranopterin monophosphate synthase MoaC [Fusibacter sp. A2]NPE23545.1 cyclic pyranopterin monophosphate synthase MoaC [Fusibacter sp. A1]RXV58956.1 cyclic pyranopterin monophosphate synthase MoaC [Fusibacter sp. A1]
MSGFTHFNRYGEGHMVDVSNKPATERLAVAYGEITMAAETIDKILQESIKKGNVISVAQIAGVMGAKKTSDLIPMCHNLLLSHVDLEFDIDREVNKIKIRAVVKTSGNTGIEMEALTSVSVAALTIYDMCKSIDKNMVIGEIKLLEKKGGKSGHYLRG